MDKAIEKEISNMKIGKPMHHRNMTVFPLNGATMEEPVYVTLKRALEGRMIKVAEISTGGSVPELGVANESGTCVLLLDGEEVIGAKQNRVLNTTILLGANTKTPIPVSCTEQGRWAYSSDEFADSDKIMNKKLRSRKSKSVSHSLHMSACYASNQGEVWEGIEELQAKSAVHSPTSAMSDVYEQPAEDLKRYEESFPSAEGQRGLLVFVDGKPAGIDLLSRAEAYAEVHPKLVRSYAMDAVADGSGDEIKPPSKKAAAAFVDCLNECQESRFKSVGLGDDLRYESPATVGSALVVDDTPVHMAFFRLDDAEDRRGSRRRESRVSSMELRRNYRRRRPADDESSPSGEG